LFFLMPQARNAAPAVFNAASIQARTYADAKASPTEVSSILEQRIRGVQEEAGLAETGRVLSVGYVEGNNCRWFNWGSDGMIEPTAAARLGFRGGEKLTGLE
jgi:hypothetical protein